MTGTNPRPENEATNSSLATPRYTPEVWDDVRMAFSSSIMVETPLTSLAQNLEGVDWPLKGPEETPAYYIDLSYDELRERLVLRGQPGSVADQLIDILKETLAFDDPFGDMVAQSEAADAADNPLVKNLEKLQLPTEFPIALTALAPETLAFCRSEKIATLGEFALAAQRMAGSVIVGGDFRALLNALSNIDEETLARYLPFRPGSKGIHYIEGLALGVYAQPPAVQAALALQGDETVADEVRELAGSVSNEQLAEAKSDLERRAGALRGFCSGEYQEIQSQLAAGIGARRIVAVLGDSQTEAAVAALIAPPAAVAPAAKGIFSRFKRWLNT